MPGYVIHLVHGEIILRQGTFHFSEIEKEQFRMGLLMPDVSQTDPQKKDKAHFISFDSRGKILEYPDLDLFPYKDKLSQPFVIGYVAHLFLDRAFYSDYFIRYVHFLDADGKETDSEAEAERAYLVTSDSFVSVKELFSEKYLYGDYTKLNYYFINKYDLNIPDNVFCEHPVAEVWDGDFSLIQKDLKMYLNTFCGDTHTKVFTAESIETAIQTYAVGFLDWLAKSEKRANSEKRGF